MGSILTKNNSNMNYELEIPSRRGIINKLSGESWDPGYFWRTVSHPVL